jgi:hypothetical protein
MLEAIDNVQRLLVGNGLPSSDFDLNPEIKLPV